MACAAVISTGAAAAAVLLPLNVAAAIFASLALVTAPAAIVVATAPALDVTSPVNPGICAAAMVPAKVFDAKLIVLPVSTCAAVSSTIVPLAFGTTSVRTVAVVTPDKSSLTCLVASVVFCTAKLPSENTDPPPPAPIRSTEAPPCRARNLALVALYQTSPSTGPARSPAAGVTRKPFCTRVRPVARSNTTPSKNVVPSALTLIVKSSAPVVPISARPENPVWNNRLAVSVAAALLILT